MASLSIAALDRTLLRLGPRPWGRAARPNATMRALANTIPEPVRQLPDAQLPSINGAVEINACGAVRFTSSLPLGQSGLVLRSASGAPEYAPHAVDQFELYRQYEQAEFPFLFNVTQACLDQQTHSIRNLILIVTLSVGGTVIGFLIILAIYWKFARRKTAARYQVIGNAASSSSLDFPQ